jgi:hypothetical protein
MPVKYDGGDLWRVYEGKKYHVTGTKGYKWVERDIARNRLEVDDLHTDMDYFQELVDEAKAAIEKYIPYKELIRG